MVTFMNLRAAFGLVLLAGGFAIASPVSAEAHPHPERVKIIPGKVTAKPARQTTSTIEVFGAGRQVTIVHSTDVRVADTELRGGNSDHRLAPNGDIIVPRATTGRSPETVMNGVRVINVRRNLRGN